MKHAVVIFLSSLLTNNFVTVKFLGLCPVLGVSQRSSTAFNMGLATSLVLTITACACYGINHFILQPLQLEYLQTIVFILLIAALVQFLEHAIQALNPILYQVLGIYLPLITTNCIVLGLSLIVAQQNYTVLETVATSLGAALGFTLVLTLFSYIREHLNSADIPAPFQGTPIAFITLGIIALSFMGFTGIIKS